MSDWSLKVVLSRANDYAAANTNKSLIATGGIDAYLKDFNSNLNAYLKKLLPVSTTSTSFANATKTYPYGAGQAVHVNSNFDYFIQDNCY